MFRTYLLSICLCLYAFFFSSAKHQTILLMNRVKGLIISPLYWELPICSASNICPVFNWPIFVFTLIINFYSFLLEQDTKIMNKTSRKCVIYKYIFVWYEFDVLTALEAACSIGNYYKDCGSHIECV